MGISHQGLVTFAVGCSILWLQVTFDRAGSAQAQEVKQVQELEKVVEERVVEGVQIGDPFSEMTPGKVLGAKQFQIATLFALEIKRIDELCHLDDSQKSKLTVAAKGVTKKLMDEFQKKGGANLAMFGFFEGDQDGQGDGEEKAQIEIQEIKAVDDIPAMTWQFIDLGDSPGEMIRNSSPTLHPMWVKVVDATLTAEQKKINQESLQAQTLQRRNAMLDLGIQQFSTQLALTPEQATQLRALAAKKIEKFEQMPPLYSGFGFLFAIADTDPAELKKVLTEPQYSYLRIVSSPIQSMLVEFQAVEAEQEEDDQDDD